MNLLLLLSALLSALTGGASAMRTPAAAHAVASAVAVVEAQVRPASVASRPQQLLPTLAVSAVWAFSAAAPAVVRAEPLYARRRRE